MIRLSSGRALAVIEQLKGSSFNYSNPNEVRDYLLNNYKIEAIQDICPAGNYYDTQVIFKVGNELIMAQIRTEDPYSKKIIPSNNLFNLNSLTLVKPKKIIIIRYEVD